MSAIFDDTRTYRYRLERPRVYVGEPPVLWVMLNPSTADEVQDDHTIRKCAGFQYEWTMRHRGAVIVVNLFALRATNPRELRSHPNPVGPDNDAHIAGAMLDVIGAGGKVIAAWGAHRFARERAAVVADDALDGAPLWCLGTTKDGSPRHPLYVPYSQPLIPWKGYQ